MDIIQRAIPPSLCPLHVTRNRLRLYAIVALFAVSIVVTAIVERALLAPPSDLSHLTQESPKPAPDIGFADLAGKAHRLSDLRGRFILLNLWAIWCAPCVREVPALARLSMEMPHDRFYVVAVALPPGSARETHDFLVAHEASVLPTYFDSQASAFPVLRGRGLPLTILVDPRGQEIARAWGPVEWDAPETVAYMRTLTGIR
jgi:thiol-disulfide isomerase/thioredoxin